MPPHNPNFIVPTAAMGTRDSRAASTGFVMQELPWFNVKDYGAVGDGVTDDTAAIQSVIDTASSGGVVWLPRSLYYVTSSLVNDGYASIVGAGMNAVTITAGQNAGGSVYNDITVLQLTSNCQDVTLEGFSLRGKGGWRDTGTFGASNTTLDVQGGENTIRKLRIDGGAQCLTVGGYDHLVDDCVITNSYTELLLVTEQGQFFRRIKADSGAGSGQDGLPARINNHAYVVDDRVTNDDGTSDCVLVCTHAGTSGGSTPTNLNYGLDIVDGGGGLIWQLASPVGFNCVHALGHDGGGGEYHFEQIDMSGSFFNSVFMDDQNGNDNSLATFDQCIFACPIVIDNARWVGFSLCEFGTTVVTTNNKPVSVVGCWGQSPMTISGTGTVKAGNVNIT